MKKLVLFAGSMVGLALLFFGTGCGSENPAQQGVAVVEQEGEALGQAAQTGAAAQAADSLEEAGDTFAAQVREQGAGKVVADAANDAGDRIENAAEIAQDTYDEKRAAGEDRLDAAGDAYNAVDRTHDPINP